MRSYIVHWGEMGARWGVNRSVAQIHALLYLVARPLPAEEIAEALTIARSNVSNSLKELQSWGLVERIQIFGDRRDHFKSLEDRWEMLMLIIEGRKKREIDPTLKMLRECADEATNDGQTDPAVAKRIIEMFTFIERLLGWYMQVRGMPKSTLIALMKMGNKVSSFVRG